MTKTEKAVYGLLKENDYLTIKQLAEAISKSEKTVSRALKALKENSYLVREGTDNDGYWKILKKKTKEQMRSSKGGRFSYAQQSKMEVID